MATWAAVEISAPEFAAAVRERLEAYRHKFMATLRRDGSPRISGIEATFAGDDLWLGMMPGSLKARDLQRDPRLALHSGSDDPGEDGSGWPGDAKLAGRAEEITDPERAAPALEAMGQSGEATSMHLFRIDVEEVALTRVGDPPDHLVIEFWRPGEGLRRMRRD